MDKYLHANIVLSKFSRDYIDLKNDLPIRPSEMGVVNVLVKRDGKLTPLAIADILGVSKTMVATHIATLEKQGYIVKQASQTDKRRLMQGLMLSSGFWSKQWVLICSMHSSLWQTGRKRR